MKRCKRYCNLILLCCMFLLTFALSACSQKTPEDETENGNQIPTEQGTTDIIIKAGDVILNAILFDNQTAKAFADMLPLTVDLWHPAPDFARAFDLPERIPRFDEEPAGREYELGSLAYWYEGPSIAVIYNASREETVVPVVPIGKIISDVSIFFEYGGTIAIEKHTPETPSVTAGTQIYRGFIVDNVYHSDSSGDINFGLYIPENYNGSKPYALYVSLCGYGGYYFQGVGINLRQESFVFEAQKYNQEMIIVAPQLNDWGNTSANQTIALTEYILGAYNIDKSKVYMNGYSGGGEMLSLVMAKKPELYTAVLHVASVWDGELEPIVKAQIPLYIVIGVSDEYYGSARISATYREMVALYERQGFTREQISELLVLDVKNADYFNGSNQHGGIGKVAFDSEVMGWLFNR